MTSKVPFAFCIFVPSWLPKGGHAATEFEQRPAAHDLTFLGVRRGSLKRGSSQHEFPSAACVVAGFAGLAGSPS